MPSQPWQSYGGDWYRGKCWQCAGREWYDERWQWWAGVWWCCPQRESQVLATLVKHTTSAVTTDKTRGWGSRGRRWEGRNYTSTSTRCPISARDVSALFFLLFLSAWFCFSPEALKMEAIFKAPTWYMHSKQKAENRPWASEWKTKQKNNNNYIHKFQHCNFFVCFFFFILTMQYPNVNHTISWYISQPHCRGGYLPSPQRKFFLPCWVFCWSFEGKPKRQPNTQLLVRTLS